MIIYIRDSNISLPNINFNEITSGVFNPDGLLNLLLFKLQEFNELHKSNNNYKLSSYNQTISNYISYGSNDTYTTDKNDTIILNHLNLRKISLFNNILDFSLNYHSNYTISAKNKLINKKLFYSTKQPELVPLLFYQEFLESSDENIIKLINEIKIIKSQRKTDIFQCLKV